MGVVISGSQSAYSVRRNYTSSRGHHGIHASDGPRRPGGSRLQGNGAPEEGECLAMEVPRTFSNGSAGASVGGREVREAASGVHGRSRKAVLKMLGWWNTVMSIIFNRV